MNRFGLVVQLLAVCLFSIGVVLTVRYGLSGWNLFTLVINPLNFIGGYLLRRVSRELA